MTVGSLNGSIRSNNQTLTLGGNLATSGANSVTLTTTGTTNVTLPTSGTIATTSQLVATPIIVPNGGTGATTLTGVLTGNGTSAVSANTIASHGVLLGGASNAVSSLAVAATGTILVGNTGADPIFSATPSFTSITLGAGSDLSSFVDWSTWTPTIFGSTTAGTTTYTSQDGIYFRVGNLVTIQFNVVITAVTGTGNFDVGNFPFTIANVASYIPIGNVLMSGSITWPAGRTQLLLRGILNTTSSGIIAAGSNISGAFLQISNTALTIVGTLTYRI